MELTDGYKQKVLDALFAQRVNFGGNDRAFALSMDINPAVYSRLKKGERDGLLSDAKYLMLGRSFQVVNKKRTLKIVQTDVFEIIKEEILFCKEYSISRMFVDNAGIGKSTTAKYMAKTEKNIFYVDGTQCKKKNAFIKALARVVGVPIKGTFDEIKDNTKYYLNALDNPVVIVDEWGALDKDAFGLVQEYWNGTEGACAWYLIGGNAAREKMEKGVTNDRDYFAEMFSRMSENYSCAVPKDEQMQQAFYDKLIRDVLEPNLNDKSKLNELVKKCMVKINGRTTGLRRADALLLLHDN